MKTMWRQAILPAAATAGPRRRSVGRILVAKLAGQPTRGKLVVGGAPIPCALGRGGVSRRKREGDGVTPAGHFRMVAVRMRTDRAPRTATRLPCRPIGRHDGWCDDAASAAYNRPIRLPAAVSHETLWRDDALYDVVVMLDYNLAHPRKGRGSAIFFHHARPEWQPTAGCVAIRADAMRRLLPRLDARSWFDIRI